MYNVQGRGLQKRLQICHGGCGVFVHVADGKVVKVKGAPASPMNKGWMCIKGIVTPEIANHPACLPSPLDIRVIVGTDRDVLRPSADNWYLRGGEMRNGGDWRIGRYR